MKAACCPRCLADDNTLLLLLLLLLLLRLLLLLLLLLLLPPSLLPSLLLEPRRSVEGARRPGRGGGTGTALQERQLCAAHDRRRRARVSLRRILRLYARSLGVRTRQESHIRSSLTQR